MEETYVRFATIPENDREKCMKLCGDRWNYSASQREVGENWVNSFFFWSFKYSIFVRCFVISVKSNDNVNFDVRCERGIFIFEMLDILRDYLKDYLKDKKICRIFQDIF